MTAEGFDWDEPISVYSREQAIEDGVLVAVPAAIAREAGYQHPVAITAGLQAVLEAPSRSEDYTGRLWDVLSVGMMRFIFAIKANRTRFEQGDTRVDYQLTFSGRTHALYLTVNPFEGFTILLDGED